MMISTHLRAALALAALAVAQGSVPLLAQEPPPAHHHDDAPAAVWNWSADASVFVGYNYQQRKFLDFSSWESQNWFMGAGDRALGRGRVTVEAMLSLEPFTLPAQGSPELFQTGESYRRVPLVNYQHPHDLVMALGATYRVTNPRSGYFVGADLVGSPTLGPMPFMHRTSARDNPTVPITHHFLDSTHITAGVVRAGASAGPLTMEASVFRGEEPDEQRLDVDQPRLDSWAVRARFDRGAWHAQVSGGHMKQPEWYEPYDMSRVTASIGFDGALRSRPVSLMVAWGGNREFNGFNGDADAALAEGRLQVTARSSIYGRIEVADKELFGLGNHPKGFSHPHVYYRVGAFTTGYVRELPMLPGLGIGGDVTWYAMADELTKFWGPSHSYHAFLRWRPVQAAPHQHQ